ncbi:hypothetical protein L1267_17890 [Pseudoalteromonas sp. OFAV1]|uniref:hypothetical protein n=1 Tax=Pseudoalteromonas sp. OFAV1 TaxID=2908892 RepID=UPI001F33C2BF|nr:hypothetical protein [Pseudoalteromonas sp. OFAV1]MCF2902244.1 hypothetical protein [Pseudoalteromonas sp. OFAV1]
MHIKDIYKEQFGITTKSDMTFLFEKKMALLLFKEFWDKKLSEDPKNIKLLNELSSDVQLQTLILISTLFNKSNKVVDSDVGHQLADILSELSSSGNDELYQATLLHGNYYIHCLLESGHLSQKTCVELIISSVDGSLKDYNLERNDNFMSVVKMLNLLSYEQIEIIIERLEITNIYTATMHEIKGIINDTAKYVRKGAVNNPFRSKQLTDLLTILGNEEKIIDMISRKKKTDLLHNLITIKEVSPLEYLRSKGNLDANVKANIMKLLTEGTT